MTRPQVRETPADARDERLPEDVLIADRDGALSEHSPLHQLEDGARGLTAKFKIQILFGPNRTTEGPNALAIQVWESGKRLHGGGDLQCYFCSEVDTFDPKTGKMAHRGTAGCGGIIPGSMAGTAIIKGQGGMAKQLVATCPSCGGYMLCERLTTELLHKVTTQNLATILADLWRKTGGDADIYVKYSPGDIRYDAMASAHGLDRARELRGLHIYTLNAIIRDTSAGAELSERFKSFLKS